MRQINIEDIRSYGPCYDPKKYLPEGWSGTALEFLNNKEIPFEDRLWVLMRSEIVSEKLMRLFAVWSARQVQHLMKDPRSLATLDVAERFANGEATEQERAAATAAARDAATAAAWAAARAAARDAARDAARAAATAAARDAATAAARAAARDAARDAATAAARAAATAAAWDAAWDAARDAAWDAATAAQENKLREMLIAGEATGDVK